MKEKYCAGLCHTHICIFQVGITNSSSTTFFLKFLTFNSFPNIFWYIFCRSVSVNSFGNNSFAIFVFMIKSCNFFTAVWMITLWSKSRWGSLFTEKNCALRVWYQSLKGNSILFVTAKNHALMTLALGSLFTASNTHISWIVNLLYHVSSWSFLLAAWRSVSLWSMNHPGNTQDSFLISLLCTSNTCRFHLVTAMMIASTATSIVGFGNIVVIVIFCLSK